MVNTLGNTPEKVTSTPNRSGSNMLKKIVAGAIALTLSGQPAEAKTYEKQEFPTEMVANGPGEISPMTENVEQANIPDYISQAQAGVRKYYPQYEGYFNNIFKTINNLGIGITNFINKNIHENFDIFSDDLKTDKDKQTTVLMVLERLIGKTTFSYAKDVTIIDPKEGYDIREGISKEICTQIKRGLKKIQYRIQKEQDITNRLNILMKKEKLTKKENEELLKIIEDFFEMIEGTEDIRNPKVKTILNMYINRCKEIGRAPNEIGKRIIKRIENN